MTPVKSDRVSEDCGRRKILVVISLLLLLFRNSTERRPAHRERLKGVTTMSSLGDVRILDNSNYLLTPWSNH